MTYPSDQKIITDTDPKFLLRALREKVKWKALYLEKHKDRKDGWKISYGAIIQMHLYSYSP